MLARFSIAGAEMSLRGRAPQRVFLPQRDPVHHDRPVARLPLADPGARVHPRRQRPLFGREPHFRFK